MNSNSTTAFFVSIFYERDYDRFFDFESIEAEFCCILLLLYLRNHAGFSSERRRRTERLPTKVNCFGQLEFILRGPQNLGHVDRIVRYRGEGIKVTFANFGGDTLRWLRFQLANR